MAKEELPKAPTPQKKRNRLHLGLQTGLLIVSLVLGLFALKDMLALKEDFPGFLFTLQPHRFVAEVLRITDLSRPQELTIHLSLPLLAGFFPGMLFLWNLYLILRRKSRALFKLYLLFSIVLLGVWFCYFNKAVPYLIAPKADWWWWVWQYRWWPGNTAPPAELNKVPMKLFQRTLSL